MERLMEMVFVVIQAHTRPSLASRPLLRPLPRRMILPLVALPVTRFRHLRIVVSHATVIVATAVNFEFGGGAWSAGVRGGVWLGRLMAGEGVCVVEFLLMV